MNNAHMWLRKVHANAMTGRLGFTMGCNSTDSKRVLKFACADSGKSLISLHTSLTRLCEVVSLDWAFNGHGEISSIYLENDFKWSTGKLERNIPPFSLNHENATLNHVDRTQGFQEGLRVNYLFVPRKREPKTVA